MDTGRAIGFIRYSSLISEWFDLRATHYARRVGFDMPMRGANKMIRATDTRASDWEQLSALNAPIGSGCHLMSPMVEDLIQVSTGNRHWLNSSLL